MRTSLFAALLLLLIFNFECLAKEPKPESAAKEKKWWEKREAMEDLYFPHKAHMKALKESGDPCLSCHPFLKNSITDIKKLEELNVIINEPMEAICHSCHVDELTASSECILCHKKPEKIWPNDHNFDYISNHGGDSILDSSGCAKCHINPSFCTDCHFKRDASRKLVHGLGYKGTHGIDARISPGRCGKCHGMIFCSDCHRSMK